MEEIESGTKFRCIKPVRCLEVETGHVVEYYHTEHWVSGLEFVFASLDDEFVMCLELKLFKEHFTFA
jgi:hypothetical protein